MSSDNNDLVVQLTESFDSWRGKYNILTKRTEPIQKIGEIQGLDPDIPESNRQNLVQALNYVYSIRVSEGQPLTNSVFTNCLVPTNSDLFFGNSSQYSISNVSGNLNIGYAGSRYLTVTEVGRVGVNIETPLSLMHINGELRSTEFHLNNPSTNRGMVFNNIPINSVNYSIIAPDSNLIINTSSFPTILNRGGGKVGIGYTAITDFDSYQSTLCIRGQSSVSGVMIESLNDKFETRLDFDGSVGQYQNGSLTVKYNSNGYVGLGVNAPQYKLHINGDSYSDVSYFGSKLYAGSNEIVDVSVGGVVTFTIPSNGLLKHGGVVVINSNGKIESSSIIGLTTSTITEATNQYFTNNRAISAVSSGVLNNVSISSNGSLKHGTKTVVNVNGFVPWGVIDFSTSSTSDINEGSKLFFTEERVVEAISTNELDSITLSESGLILHGSKTIVSVDGLVPWGVIDFSTSSTSDINEGSKLFFTEERVVEAISTNEVSLISLSIDGVLKHGTQEIVRSDGKISSSVVDFDGDITLGSVLNLKPYPSSSRPTTGIKFGTVICDETLSLPIFYDGSSWKKFDGTVV